MGNCFFFSDEAEFSSALKEITKFEEKVESHLLHLVIRVDNIKSGKNKLEKSQLGRLLDEISKVEIQLEKYHILKKNLYKQQSEHIIKKTNRSTESVLKNLNFSNQFNFSESVLHQQLDYDRV